MFSPRNEPNPTGPSTSSNLPDLSMKRTASRPTGLSAQQSHFSHPEEQIHRYTEILSHLYHPTEHGSESPFGKLQQNGEVLSQWAKIGFRILRFMTTHVLVLLVNASIGMAIFTTWALHQFRPSFTPTEIKCMNAIGMMYLNALHSVLIPIIASSVIASMARLDVRFLGSIGLCTFLYFMCTTFLAVMLGIVLVQTIKPGEKKGVRRQDYESGGSTEDYIDTLLDMFRSLFPSSVVEAALYYPQAVLQEEPVRRENDKDYDGAEGSVIVARDYGNCMTASSTELYCTGTNYPGMVVCYMMVGITLGTIRNKYETFVMFFKSLNDALLRIVHCLVWTSPIGIYFLTVSKMVKLEEISDLIGHIMQFLLTVVLGVCFHTFVTLPIVYVAVTHKLPFRLWFNLFDAIVAAFATSSSVATMPQTLYCMETKNHVPPIVTRFVIPLGATVNMDGSALYEAVAPIFIAQLHQVNLSVMQVISISLTATLASLGTSGVPQAGLMNMMIVLRMLKLPEEDVGLILAVDWILDRFRTAANVIGDSIGSAVVYSLCKNQINRAGLDIQEGEDDELLKLFETNETAV